MIVNTVAEVGSENREGEEKEKETERVDESTAFFNSEAKLNSTVLSTILSTYLT
jgi:hypothetical protein